MAIYSVFFSILAHSAALLALLFNCRHSDLQGTMVQNSLMSQHQLCSLALLTHSLASQCLFCSGALLRSFICLLTYPQARGRVNDQMFQINLVLSQSASYSKTLIVNPLSTQPQGVEIPYPLPHPHFSVTQIALISKTIRLLTWNLSPSL